jgi:hypothetical protein
MLATMRAHTVLLALAVGCGSSGGPRDAAVVVADVSVAGSPDTTPPPANDVAPPADIAPPAPDAEAAPIDPTLAARAREIAGQYLSWGRVDDEYHWAPGLCRLPLPGVARMSASTDPSTHGQKLYSVFVKNFKAYPMGPSTDQAVVKQSWTVERVTDPTVKYDPEKYRENPDGGFQGDHFYPYAMQDGVLYRADQPAGLYIMFKVDPATPNTDGGWVYATITAAGQLTAAGKVKSCIGCHQEAPNDRLFGVPKSQAF